MQTVIPYSLPLVGVSLFPQFAVLDPAGSFGGLLSFTGGLQGIVGLSAEGSPATKPAVGVAAALRPDGQQA